MAEINVTPFVDVMLVLLIVFMVTAPLLLAGVQVDLPESRAAGMPGQEEPISVTVDASGRVYVQESEVEIERLGTLLLAISEENPDVRIFVRGDRTLSYGRIMQVIGTVNAAGFRRVALVSEPLESGG
jgi:biopolymer transport protein TolR